MFTVKIITIGKCKETWLANALLEYEKRLTPYAKVFWILLKDNKELTKYSEKLHSYICLDPNGKLLNSEELSSTLLNKFSAKLNFIIGGSDGICKKILDKSSLIISLSKLTFTHQITRLILLEQFYRSIQISTGSRYHK